MDPAEGRRILVAVDEGDESVHALRWCLTNFATRGGGGGGGGDGELAPPDTILLLYVRPTPPTYSVLDASAPLGYLFANEATAAIDGYSRAVADAVVDKAQKLCALHSKEKGEVKVDVKVAVGDARSVICDMVDKLGADVLVMGSHGYGFFKRLPAVYVARWLRCLFNFHVESTWKALASHRFTSLIQNIPVKKALSSPQTNSRFLLVFPCRRR